MDKQKSWEETASLEDALQHGLSEEEYGSIRNVLERDISILELGICSSLYSEHCSYKSSKVHLKTLPTEGPRVIQGPGENAGVIDIDDNEAVVFKVESHNHPTFIEPYQGAATGVGGILRDVFTMGARPVALMNSLRFGAKGAPRTDYLLSRAVEGIGGYGNCMGVPTVGGELFFHKAYNGNCLVNAFALGLVDQDKIFLGEATGVGNSIFYVGSKTGRDGIHGATMASETFEEDSDAKRPTVQVGDPFQEKLLLEACLATMATGAVVGIQDMGAAGMTSSSYEMADRAGTGVRIDLDMVPQREEGMTPYEIMLSESQERMLVIVEKGREQEVLDVVTHWELDVVKIGEVTDSGNVDLYWHGDKVSTIPAAALTSSVPELNWPEKQPESYTARQKIAMPEEPRHEDFGEIWLQLLGSENICSRADVYNQYDSTVRTNTVVHPGGDAAVIRVKSRNPEREDKGVAMTLDCNSRYCDLDPRAGAAHAVAEAYRNISATGSEAIGISDCLNFGSPEVPESMWQIAEGIRGLGEAASVLETPVVSGNVSLYNQTGNSAILPTPLIAMVGMMNEAQKAVTVPFKDVGDAVLLLGETNPDEIGGSDYLAIHHGIEGGVIPELKLEQEKKMSLFIRELVADEILASCHDLSSGGLALALAECCLSGEVKWGATVSFNEVAGRSDGLLFSESAARYLVSCSQEKETEIRKRAEKYGISIEASGFTGGDSITISGLAGINLNRAADVWSSGLEELII